MWEFETEEAELGAKIICGVDEAGRGPLAGPVCAAAVILPFECEINGLNDSKKISEKKREQLFPIITENALSYAVAFSSIEEIEEINILNAAMLAMSRALNALGITPDVALIDGNKSPETNVKTRTIIKGDSLSANIAAASILAKVSRDRLMYEIDKEFPQYGFGKHKGYGTKDHIEAIKKYGPCKYHRMSFIRKFL